METLIYWMVKVIATVYLLYRTARFLFGQRKTRLWLFLTPQIKEKEKTDVSPAKPEAAVYAVVGKSQTTYLTETPQAKTGTVEPAFSEDLQQLPAYEEEPDITATDVDDSLDGEEIAEEDRFLPLDTVADDGEFSTGMTFEQLSDTLDVVRGKQTGAAGLQAAARILYENRGSTLFDFLAAQAENEQVIEALLREHLDDSGNPLPESGRKRRRMEAFDMNNYV